MEDIIRIVYDVLPGDGRGGWDVKKEGEPAPIKHFEVKEEAVQYGRELAKREHLDGGLGQLHIHDRRGRIENEWTYGEDPRNVRG